MANVKPNTQNILREMNYDVRLCDKYDEDCSVEDATHAAVVIFGEDGIRIKTLELPKSKEIGVDWFLNKLENNKLYKNLSSIFSKILNIGNGTACVYPATYGIGFTNYIFRDIETAKKLQNILDKNGIEYKTEYSDAFYVYRFVISKKKDNIDKIKQLIDKKGRV